MTGVLVPTVNEQAWLDVRRSGVSASEIAVVMGLSPYSSPLALYYRKTGQLPEQPDTDAMAIGRAMENFVCDQFGRRHPEFALAGSGRELWRHASRPWQMATPDRTVSENLGLTQRLNGGFATAYGDLLAVLEAKVDNGDGFGDEGTDVIPVHYRCQVLWQMDTLGVTTGYLAALIWHRRQVRVFELSMDDRARADLRLMRGEAEAFLQRIADRNPPEPDWRPATRKALQHVHADVEPDVEQEIGAGLADAFRFAVAQHKAAEQEKDELSNKVRAAMGTARYATQGGQRVARRDVYPVREHVRKASVTDKIVHLPPKGTTSDNTAG